MTFKVEETCTWEDWDAWRKTYTLHGKVTGKVVRAAAGFLKGWGIFMMALGGLLLLMGVLGGLLNFFTLLGAGLLLIGWTSFRRKGAREGLSDRRVEETFRSNIADKPMRFAFEDDGFSVWEPAGSGSYRYHALTAVWEDEARYYLFLQEKMRYILRKGAFTQGTPDGFRALISQKTGKSVEYIK